MSSSLRPTFYPLIWFSQNWWIFMENSTFLLQCHFCQWVKLYSEPTWVVYFGLQLLLVKSVCVYVCTCQYLLFLFIWLDTSVGRVCNLVSFYYFCLEVSLRYFLKCFLWITKSVKALWFIWIVFHLFLFFIYILMYYLWTQWWPEWYVIWTESLI